MSRWYSVNWAGWYFVDWGIGIAVRLFFSVFNSRRDLRVEDGISKRIELKLSIMRYQNSQGFAIMRYVLIMQVVVKISDMLNRYF